MTESIFPATGSTHLASSDFVIAAGCILFRRSPTTIDQLQICLLHAQPKEGKEARWLLPKGRKDAGESIAAAAIRETFEETGYPCEHLPCRMPTRAPAPGVNTTDAARVMDNSTEPVAVTMRGLGEDGCKFIWWFLARVKGEDTEKVVGTQTESEDYVSEFFDAREGIEKLSVKDGRDIASQALAIVEGNVKARGMDVVFGLSPTTRPRVSMLRTNIDEAARM